MHLPYNGPYCCIQEGFRGVQSHETEPDSLDRLLLVGGFWFVTTHFSPRLVPLSIRRCSATVAPAPPLELTEAQAAPAYDAEEQNNIAIYKRVLPSVVNITSTTLVFDFFYGTVPQQGQGSGFILDKAGHILTNFHVVEGANRGIEVQLSNKRRYTATVVGTDKVHDLALLQIDAPDLAAGHAGRFLAAQRGPEGLRHRQSLRAERHHDARHHQRHPPDPQRETARRLKTRSRPTRPSIPATPAGRC